MWYGIVAFNILCRHFEWLLWGLSRVILCCLLIFQVKTIPTLSSGSHKSMPAKNNCIYWRIHSVRFSPQVIPVWRRCDVMFSYAHLTCSSEHIVTFSLAEHESNMFGFRLSIALSISRNLILISSLTWPEQL